MLSHSSLPRENWSETSESIHNKDYPEWLNVYEVGTVRYGKSFSYPWYQILFLAFGFGSLSGQLIHGLVPPCHEAHDGILGADILVATNNTLFSPPLNRKVRIIGAYEYHMRSQRNYRPTSTGVD